MEIERVPLTAFIGYLYELEDGEGFLLSETISFNDETWLLRAFYDDFSDTTKLILTHCTQCDLYPSAVFDLPVQKNLATWKVWFEHVLRIKSLMTEDKHLYVDKIDWDYIRNKDMMAIPFTA